MQGVKGRNRLPGPSYDVGQESINILIIMMNNRKSPENTRKNRDPEVVAASEIASYVFCPEAWRLGVALGLEANNERDLLRGERTHGKIAAVEQASQARLRLGLALVALGLVILGVWIFLVSR